MNQRPSRFEVFVVRAIVILGFIAFVYDAAMPKENLWMDENGHEITTLAMND